jgi:hypothetical protein
MPRTRKTKFPYVYRAVYPKEYIDGYIAKIVRKSGRLFNVFQLADYKGDHDLCLRAAAKTAAAFDKEHPKLPRWQIAQMRRDKKDKDLPTGVRRVVKVVNGKKYKFIEASWSPEPNVQKKRHFAVHKYGQKKALSLALAERKAGVEVMANR